MIASYLFFFAFEIRIPPTLPRARVRPVSGGGEPAGDPNPGTQPGGKASSSARGRRGQRQRFLRQHWVGFESFNASSSCSCAVRYLRSPGAARGPRRCGDGRQRPPGPAALAEAVTGRVASRLLTLALSLHPEELKPLEMWSHCSRCALGRQLLSLYLKIH